MSWGLYPQNGYRIVTIDSVTSLHPLYTLVTYLLAMVSAAAAEETL